MALSYGHFVWRELMSTDLAAARDFYGKLFGWTYQEMDMGGMTYVMALAGDAQVAGLMATPQPGMPSAWWSYAHVHDVDASLAAAKAAGATPIMEAMDVPNIGRMAGFIDPQGAAVAIFRSLTPQEKSTDPSPPGHFCWESLNTSSVEASIAFYPAVTGWTVGNYGPEIRTFVAEDTQTVCNISLVQGGAPPHWLTYVAVKGLPAVVARARELGAHIIVDEAPVPNAGRLAIFADPTGSVIGIFEAAMPA